MNTIARNEVPALGGMIGDDILVARYWVGDQEIAMAALPASAEIEGVWGEYGRDVSTTHGDGLDNTIAMAEAGSEIARKALAIGAHIPSAFECHALMVAKQAGHITDLDEDSRYWSSTQRSSGYAFSMIFGIGYQYVDDKICGFRVRPVRRLLIQ